MLILPPANAIANCKILVVGDVMLDRYWHGQVTRISPEAPVPVVHVQREENRLGGAANVALNIRNIGARVTLLSVIGEDDAALTLRQLLSKQGIDAELDEVPSIETIVKLRIIGHSQQVVRVDFEKKPNHGEISFIAKRFESLLLSHDVVLFSDYGKGSLAEIDIMISKARAAGKPVLIDPKGSSWDRYKGASLITPNRNELADVIGSWSAETELIQKVDILRNNLGLNALLLTRSEEGMTLFEASGVNSVLANAREVADVTGAGDTVIAVLALMIACGLNLYQATLLANKAAGLVVAKFGTASLTYAELANET
jgi:rfaE bifunctional protein kinase chain/domain